jgi:hypothetical protein
MCFKTGGFEVINATEVLEEERFEEFKTGRYYPVNIGEIFSSKYQVIGKLGFGVTSTVWLARDLQYVSSGSPFQAMTRLIESERIST